MAKTRIKVGDTVRVISGSEKDNEGKVISIDRKKNTLKVEGVHMVKKHMKPSMANQAGGIVEQEGPIAISNVMVVSGGQVTRVGYRIEDGKKVRYAKKTGKVLD